MANNIDGGSTKVYTRVQKMENFILEMGKKFI